MTTTPLPLVMTKEGLTPQTATALRAELVADVASTNPGYTANLPGSLIEDIASTDVAAIAMCDSALVELVNSITPYGANEFLLIQLGQIYGIPFGQPTNASVYVVFTGVQGFVIVKGFTVSDGSHQYIVQDGGIIGSLGTVRLFCVAANSGDWAIPANTVDQIITSVPASIGLSCINPDEGVSSTGEESIDNYRARVLQAGRAASQGMPSYLRSLLNNVYGVQSRLIAIRLIEDTSWQIIVGGSGDPYSIAYAIFTALFDISNLVGSETVDRNVVVTINDYPDFYNITFVTPVAQTVQLNITWNTTAINFVSGPSVDMLASNALATYINTIVVGNPINVLEMQTVFQESIASIIPAQYLSKLVIQVYIDSILVPPISGTELIEGDAEGYFITDITLITINRG